MRRSSLDPGTSNDFKPLASAASPIVNFTFVNQAEDLGSLTARKITNQEQRHVIRSHVMKSVRQEELARGKKRSIGRDHGRRSDLDKAQSTSSDSDSSHKNQSPGPLTVVVKQELEESGHDLHIVGDKKTGHSGATWLTTAGSTGKMTYVPAVIEFDPFDTLPCTSLAHQGLESLLQYCFDVLLPLTFSVETKQPRDRLARQGLVLQSKISSPATFMGFMATAAAHRAIFRGHHKDLAPSDENHDDLITDRDYKTVKHEALVAVRRKVESRERIDNSLVDACFGLVAAATVVGNFEEARMHLKGISQVMSMVGVAQDSILWVPLANVKVSVGLLSKPLLPLPWPRSLIPQKTLERIIPPPDSAMGRMASDFQHLEGLSQSLKALLSTSRDICNFCELNTTDPRGLSSTENATLRQKSTELEFDLLSYPHETATFLQGHGTEPRLPPLEAIIRLAALGFLSFAPHTVIPPSGLGRALTHHQKRAVQVWLKQRSVSCSASEMKAVTWALFIFAQNSLQQPEEGFFCKLLFHFTRVLGLGEWQDIETTAFGFLYIPSLQSSVWNAIWTTSSNNRPLSPSAQSDTSQV